MSGHSKWSNIKHRKEKGDAQKAKLFTKVGREIGMIVKAGGADPAANPRLRDAIAKAKSNNVPNDNIQRMIQKASGDGDAASYIEITYEGYGPGGVAVIVETLTDNRNRTAGEIRHYFDKYGGNMGAAGCVSWQFERKGVLIIDGDGRDEEEFFMLALESGAADVENLGEVFEVTTTPDDFSSVSEALEQSGIAFLSAEIALVAQNGVLLEADDDCKNMQKMLEMFEDNDDVQNVYHNCENEDL